MSNSGIRTGIEALDSMLGGELPGGSLVLLRGTPASGKTTLAIQILANHLSSHSKSTAAFVSLQANPAKVIQHARSAFSIGLDADGALQGKENCFTAVGRAEVEGAIRSIQDVSGPSLGECLANIIKKGLGSERRDASDREKSPCLIVIDSLDILANMIMHKLQSQEPRVALRSICGAIRSAFGWAAVILTVEHDPTRPTPSIVSAENFCCDTEIFLGEEPVLLGPAMPNRLARKEVETRLFCRVLKSAGGPRQSRRCVYDIVPNRGIAFYETYPGGGYVLLFAENVAQHAAWEEFFTRDVPELYPALDCEISSRGSFQRTFASLRRFREMPERTDMYLSSFDTYWVNWYVELCQRWAIADRIRPILVCGHGPETSERARFSRIVGTVHRKLTEWVVMCKHPDEVTDAEILKLADRIADYVCTGCALMGKAHCTGKWGRLADALKGAWLHLSSEEGQSGLLQPIAWNDLRLFSERRSPIIKELEDYRPPENRPVFRLSHRRDTEKVLGLPYDANISFIVCRKNLLQKLKAVKPYALASEMRKIYEEDERDLGEFLKVQGGKRQVPKLGHQIEPAIRDLTEKLLKGDGLPQTWEEIIALCKANKPRPHFLIETQKFDRFLCTLLEFVWGCGGDLKVFSDYSIENKEETGQRMFQAFNLLRRLFEEGIIPRHCSQEPADVARQFPPGHETQDKGDWVFARHWYSSFVDLLTARNAQGGYLWQPDGQLEVMPIPVSLSRYVEQKGEPTHVSCWGEWYLAAMRGGENKALAVDVINNIMSAQRICDRAFHRASVPTVEQFYEMYGNAECFHLPQRNDLSLPKTTYNELRKMLFGSAKSRTQVFDYRNTMRELHPILHYLQGSSKVTAQDLGQRVCDALSRIESLAGKELMLF